MWNQRLTPMNIVQENQMKMLEEHHKQCLDFWKREKHSELSAMAMALIDIIHTKHNPFVPRGERLDADVRKTTIEKYLQEFCDCVRTELENSIQTD